MTDRETERPRRDRDWTDRQTKRKEKHIQYRKTDRDRDIHTYRQTERQGQKRENRGERLAGFKVL